MDHARGKFESAVNKVILRIRAQRMPKAVKRIKTVLSSSEQNEIKQHWEVGRQADLQTDCIYYSQYIGSCLVDDLVEHEPGANYHNTGLGAKAMDCVLQMARIQKMQNVCMIINKNRLMVLLLPTRSVILDVPIDRIPFCATVPKYSKVTAFVARNSTNQTMECHAFLCHRQKLAKAIADTLIMAMRASKKSRCESPGTRLRGDGDTSTRPSFRQNDTNDKLRSLKITSEILGNKHEWKKVEPKQPKQYVSDHNHNLEPDYSAARRNVCPSDERLIDDGIKPMTRARSDSDSWAVFATNTDNFNDELEQEFSRFAYSRSFANLADLDT